MAPPITRRDFLKASTVALAGAATTSLNNSFVRAETQPKRNLITIMAQGGWDTTYSLDSKPGIDTVDSPEGEVQMFGDLPIFTHASRPNVTTFFDAYASVTNIIKGIDVRSISHPVCVKQILTGTPSETNPDIAAIAAHQLGTDLPVPYLILGNAAYMGPLASSSGRVGFTNQLSTLLDPLKSYAPSTFIPDTNDEAAIRNYIQAQAEREKAIRGQHGYNKARIEDFIQSLEKGDLLKPYSNDLGELGVRLSLEAQLKLAADVIEKGMSHSVMVDSGSRWDTHDNNERQGPFHDALFKELKDFLEDLSGRSGQTPGNSMLDETVVLVISEMTRTPKINDDDGKDHWGHALAMVCGGGVAGGKICGGTDDQMAGLPVNLETGELDSDNGNYIQTEQFLAGVLELLGTDSTTYFNGVTPLRGMIGAG